MAEPILWISPGACSLAPHILIREAEIDFKTVVISAKAGFPEELRDVIPKARVPIFQLGDETITEVAAIMSAISQISTKKNLLGKTNLEIVRTYEWFNWISGTLHGQAFGGIRRPHRFSDEQEDSRGKLYVRKGVDKTHDHRRGRTRGVVMTCVDPLPYIEENLKGNHAVGDTSTAVDAYLLVMYRWGNETGYDMRVKYPKFYWVDYGGS